MVRNTSITTEWFREDRPKKGHDVKWTFCKWGCKHSFDTSFMRMRWFRNPCASASSMRPASLPVVCWLRWTVVCWEVHLVVFTCSSFFQLSQRDYLVLHLVEETVADRNLFLNTTTFADKAADKDTDSSGGNKHVSGFSHTCVEKAKHFQTYNCVAFFTHVCLFPYMCVKIQTCVENSTQV